MAKGSYTQGVVVLFRQPLTLSELEGLLSEFRVVKRNVPFERWEFSGPSLTVEYLPEVNGYVVVDVVDGAWPDHMGDPKGEVELFAAWSMGHFGPYAFPLGLERAVQHSWSWSQAGEVIGEHRAFVRIRSSYVLGPETNDDTLVMPQSYDPVAELHFLMKMTESVMRHPDALAYFNPNGEKLLDRETLKDLLEYHNSSGLPPLPVWTNIRFLRIDQKWMLMDSVGNWQLDMPDHEAIFPDGKFEPAAVDNFLLNAALYILKNGHVVKDGDTMDGPGDVRWQAKLFDSSVSEPPRAVLRWFPMGERNYPRQYLEERGSDTPQGRKPWWKKW